MNKCDRCGKPNDLPARFCDECFDSGITYQIVRFYRDTDRQDVIKTGLTLKEAQEHCNDPESSSSTATSKKAQEHTRSCGPWFDGYREE